MTQKEKAKELFDKFYYLFPEKHRIDFGNSIKRFE